MRSLVDWFDAGFESVVPVVPLDAQLSPLSHIKPETRGKVIGRRNGSGLWSSWNWVAHQTTRADCLSASWAGAGVGLRLDHNIAVDIDILDPQYAQIVQDTAESVLGWAPVRVGLAPKRVMLYRVAEPVASSRMWFTEPEHQGGAEHLVEILGAGHHVVVDGLHNKTGKPYQWDYPPVDVVQGAKLGINQDLNTVTFEQINQFKADVTALLSMLGCDATHEGATRRAGERALIDQDRLRGDIGLVLEAIEATPNSTAAFPLRADYIRYGCAIKAALGDTMEGLAAFHGWAARWDEGANNPEVVDADWRRFQPPFEVGSSFLFGKARDAGWTGEATAVFDAEDLPPAAADEDDMGEIDGDGRPVIYSDIFLARQFVSAQRERLRYVPARKEWLHWDGVKWAKDDVLAARKASTAICAKASGHAMRKVDTPQKAERLAGRVASNAVVNAVLSIAQADPELVRRPESFDEDVWLLNTPGGIVDLRTGAVRPCDPSENMTKATAVAPADTADCPQFFAFMHETTGGDLSYIDYTQRVLGNALTGSAREQKIFFAQGEGGNGKGTLFNCIHELLADYAVRAPNDVFEAQDGREGVPTNIAMLHGARLVTASETQAGKSWNEKRVKELTGQDPITARFLYQDNFTFIPQATFVLMGNHAPQIRNIDEAMRRRVRILPFNIKPAVVDLELSEKLRREWPGILRWVIDGAVKWYRGGLIEPECVTRATAEYFDEEDKVGRWLRECAELDPSARTPTAELFGSWRAWAERGNIFPGDIARFGRELKKRRFESGKMHGGKSVYVGLRVRQYEFPDTDGAAFAGMTASATASPAAPQEASR